VANDSDRLLLFRIYQIEVEFRSRVWMSTAELVRTLILSSFFAGFPFLIQFRIAWWRLDIDISVVALSFSGTIDRKRARGQEGSTYSGIRLRIICGLRFRFLGASRNRTF
jgi:hypothetical protein